MPVTFDTRCESFFMKDLTDVFKAGLGLAHENKAGFVSFFCSYANCFDHLPKFVSY